MRLLFFVTVLSVTASPVAFLACGGSSGAQTFGLDAAAPQAVGAACNPAAAEPCLPSGDVCTGVVCDPVLLVCKQYDTDAGGACSADVAPCTTTADCEPGLTCAFPATGGCSAQGTCIDPPLPCEDDAASCGTEAPACGCDGLPDPFVVPGYAASPVFSLSPCVDGGASLDASPPTDAPLPTDAPSAPDSSEDATGA